MDIPKRVKNIIGLKFGSFEVLEFYGTVDSIHGSHSLWKCKCECGKIKNLKPSSLRRKNRPVTCGCSRKKRSERIFYSNFEKTEGCWIWQGSINKGGYGKIGTTGSAHRRSYEYHIGKIPTGKQVCHTCDNRLCVNPEHFFLGSIGDNMRDRTKKNRQAKGSSIACSIVNEEKVLEIRKMRLEGNEYQKIADHFGIKWGLVRSVCKKSTWKHVGLYEECKSYVSRAGGYRKSESFSKE